MTNPNPEVVPPDPPEVAPPEKQVNAPDVEPKPLKPDPVVPMSGGKVSPENQPLEERDA